jgi:hypothetical protein
MSFRGVLALTAVLFLAPTAENAAGVSYEQKTEAVSGFDATAVTCDRPSRRDVVAGGMRLSAGHDNGYLAGLFPRGAIVGPDSWEAQVNALTPAELTTYVVCMPKGWIEPDGKTELVGPSAAKTLKVPCPGGSAGVTGGGVDMFGDGFQETELLESHPYDGRDADERLDDGWLGRAKNLQAQGKQRIFVQALCAPPRYDGRLRYISQSTGLVTDGVQYTTEAACPRGEPVLGGGFGMDAIPEAVNVHATFPGEEPIDGYSYWRNEFDFFLNESRDVWTYAVCLK